MAPLKLQSKTKPRHKKPEPEKVALVAVESSSEEDDDIDEEGYKRLMDALGEDGLNDFDKANLETMLGEGDDSESGEEDDEGEQEEQEQEEQDEEEEDEEQEQEDIALDSLEYGMLDEDVVPRQKVEIDNKLALERIRRDIALDSSIPWTETLAITYPQIIDVDVNDDLARELAFYNQALHSAKQARTLASKSKPPLAWTRPADYFAEMVKSDSHMERIRQRLLDEKATIKKSEDMKKQREGKKFGKQVQMEKLKEREKSKKDMEERLRGLKRKRKDVLPGENGGGEEFDVAVEDAISDKSRPTKKAKMPRPARDQKFGYGGGAGRRSKQNTKSSTDDFNPREASGSKGKKGGKKAPGGAMKRPGKTRRMVQRGKR